MRINFISNQSNIPNMYVYLQPNWIKGKKPTTDGVCQFHWINFIIRLSRKTDMGIFTRSTYSPVSLYRIQYYEISIKHACMTIVISLFLLSPSSTLLNGLSTSTRSLKNWQAFFACLQKSTISRRKLSEKNFSLTKGKCIDASRPVP